MDAVPLTIGPGGIFPSDQDGWRALGECIGSHQHLQELIFREIDATHETIKDLMTGVSQNRSVRKLEFCDCHGEWPLGILQLFFQNNHNLSSIDVNDCCDDISSSLLEALRGCTSRSLEHIGISCNAHGTGYGVAGFIEALAGLPHLKELEFYLCILERRGCDAVAALLQSPVCMLQKIFLDCCDVGDEGIAVLEPEVAASSTLTELSLHGLECSTAALQTFLGVLRSQHCMLKILDIEGNKIGDDELMIFADALATNHKLEILKLDHEDTISDIGFAAVARALCNTSSIGNVHRSNHTLKVLVLDGLNELPDYLRNYLRMNEREDKSLVAREKIFMHYFRRNFNMDPFHENAMAPNILPHLLDWVGRIPDGESFTALFYFLRRMPPLWGNVHPALRRSGRKRKVLS